MLSFLQPFIYVFICRSTVAQLNGNETHVYTLLQKRQGCKASALLHVFFATFAWRIILLTGDTHYMLHSQNDRKRLKLVRFREVQS